MNNDMVRIGVAVAGLPGALRQHEYGIYRLPNGGLVARYEGYRQGSLQVGLPLAGPHAAHRQPLVPFKEREYTSVRFF